MSGWIKLHRSITEWEWYEDEVTFRVFLHLLLTCNHKPKKWQGVTVDAGQKITSPDAIANEIGTTRQRVRTALHKLERSGDIVQKSTNRYTLVSIAKWAFYQSCEDELTNNQPSTNQQSTNNQPTANQQLTTNKNDKNVKNEKNERNITRHKAVIDFDNWPRSLTDDELQAINANRKAKRSPSLNQKTADLALVEIRKACTNGLTFDDCIDEWISRGWVSVKSDWLTKDKPKAGQPTTEDFQAFFDATIPKG